MQDKDKEINEKTSQPAAPSAKPDKEQVKYSAADQVVEEMHRRTLRDRLKEVKTTRWIRFAIVSAIFFGWVIWMGNPWLLFIWIILADIYLTCYVPWNWWKRSSNPLVRTIMNWVDAIVYALILVYFIFAFIGQNYTIPSSSLEKSLLVGDYLWVNKVVYGPRVPQTPIHFPLTQNTFPGGAKSYMDHPQLAYHRLPGLRSVERGDIVVFNYPQGDTVLTNVDLAQGDYYEILERLRGNGIEDPRQYIRDNPGRYGEIIWRPVDRRENYVKRAVGLPGDRLMIVDDIIYINGKPLPTPTQAQFNYLVVTTTPVPDQVWADINVRRENRAPITDLSGLPEYKGLNVYSVPLTEERADEVAGWPNLAKPLQRMNDVFPPDVFTPGIFPAGNPYNWTRSNMGEIWIPQRGKTVKLTLNNLPLYRRIIDTYEGNKLEVHNGKIFINDKQADSYTFRMDYYWMMGDNRDFSADSRYWGFVPEDHIIGSPMFTLISFDEEQSWGSGNKIRWDRIFRNANPDKNKLFAPAKP